MANIQKVEGKRGTKYRALVRMKGCPPQSATFDRLTDAREWAKRTESAIKERRYFKTAEAQRHTASDMIDKYLKHNLSDKKSSDDMKRHLLFWKEKIGAYTLADVTPALIGDIRDNLYTTPIITVKKVKERIRKEGGKAVTVERLVETRRQRNAATVNRYMAALGHVLTVAANEWQWMENNPMVKVKKFAESRGRVRFLSDDERARFLSACQESKNPYLYTVVILALSTGMRHAEMMNLTWDRVDFTNKRIVLEETKNGERRSAPLVGKAYELLDAMRKLEAAKTAEKQKVIQISTKKPESKPHPDLVFPGTHAMNTGPASIRTAFLFALKKAEITNFKFHDLRHCTASYLAMNGATLAEIAAVLGHKTLSMVKRYAHLSDQHVSTVVEKMNQKIFG